MGPYTIGFTEYLTRRTTRIHVLTYRVDIIRNSTSEAARLETLLLEDGVVDITTVSATHRGTRKRNTDRELTNLLILKIRLAVQ